MSNIGATAPPAHATVDGEVVDYAPIIDVIAHRYFATGHPHGDVPEHLARRWHAHDTAYLLQWAIDDISGYGSLERELRWLADVLHSRNFPLDGLAANLDLMADVINTNTGLPTELVTCLRDGSRAVREIAAELGAGPTS
ncbi:MAG: hypothetical protein WD225_04195 [Ilumatobacteraceae bacterium]